MDRSESRSRGLGMSGWSVLAHDTLAGGQDGREQVQTKARGMLEEAGAARKPETPTPGPKRPTVLWSLLWVVIMLLILLGLAAAALETTFPAGRPL